MKNILFITSECYPLSDANGICCMELAKCFKKNGCNVSILCGRRIDEKKYYEIDGIKIYKGYYNYLKSMIESTNNIKNNGFRKVIFTFFKVFEHFLIFINLFRYPIHSYFSLYRLKRLGKSICLNDNIDTVISIIHPVESLLITKYIVKKNKGLYFNAIFLDSLSYGLVPTNFLEKIKINRLTKWEKDIFDFNDNIIIMEAYRDYYSKKMGVYKNKIMYSDIPLFSKIEKNVSIKKDKGIKFIYSGTLYRDIRNPKLICEIFTNISKNKNYKFDFYSKGDCEDIIEKYSKLSKGKIKRNGYVSRDVLLDNILSSDIIVSIGSNNCDMVPSKIFEYMSTGKKILHIICYKNDAAVNYLNKYPNVLFINSDDNLDEISQKIEKFINSKNVKIDLKMLETQFKKNIPEYTFNLIKEKVKNEK